MPPILKIKNEFLCYTLFWAVPSAVAVLEFPSRNYLRVGEVFGLLLVDGVATRARSQLARKRLDFKLDAHSLAWALHKLKNRRNPAINTKVTGFILRLTLLGAS